ncbi:restriction endonuclease subunit S [Cycloclasticus pugetii]|uniref:restriction endonuclease subunit S n=1 Tax=Cycloclasticus pugetii TaxID=34068 RepID=UPI003A8D873C
MNAVEIKSHMPPAHDFTVFVPVNWQLCRLKDKATFNPSKTEIKVIPSNCTFAPMEKLKTDLLLTDETTTFSEVSGSYTYFREGDILVAKVTPCFENRNIAIAKNLTNGVGFGSSEINVVRLTKKAHQRWFFYLFLSSYFVEAGASRMAGAGGLKRVPTLFLQTFSFALPPICEQIAISTYLDTKTGEIDRKIDLLGRKAKQYDKLKQSLINEIVSGGLDKSIPMKDSCVDWIGQVPEHWNLKRLKDLGYLYSGLAGKSGEDFTEEHINSSPFIPFTNIANNFYLSIIDLKHVIIGSEEKQNTIDKNDLFFLMSSEDFYDLGKSSLLLEKPAFPIYLNSFCKGYRFIKKDVDPRFINYLLHSSECRAALFNEGRGFTRINLRMNKINDISLCLPPTPEQTAIANYLDTKTSQINSIVTTINTQIGQLTDLRKALINDVVTGKIKVVSGEGQGS